MLSEHDEEFEFIASVTAEYGVAKGFSIAELSFVARKLITDIRIL